MKITNDFKINFLEALVVTEGDCDKAFSIVLPNKNSNLCKDVCLIRPQCNGGNITSEETKKFASNYLINKKMGLL
jgi:hypothetical protein